jgi:hypothetical protein
LPANGANNPRVYARAHRKMLRNEHKIESVDHQHHELRLEYQRVGCPTDSVGR